MRVDEITPNPRNARTHPKKQIARLKEIIETIGFTSPLLVDENGLLLAGHARLGAAKLAGLTQLPVVRLTGLSEGKKRALLLADNKIAEGAGWDRERLAIELPELAEVLHFEELHIGITGFEAPEIDQLVSDFEEASDPDDEIPAATTTSGPVVSAAGDVWLLGGHRLMCGNACDPTHVSKLIADEHAAMAFLDPPYNVKVAGIVGRGAVKHDEFAMASGEMSPAEFTRFLAEALGAAAAVSRGGAVHFVCMDWRHIGELVNAGGQAYGEMLNLVVWEKTNAGQGSFYRSQHELIGVFRVAGAQHLNNVELGKHGRSRSNIWRYAGVNTFRAGRMDDLRAHPTVKPVGMIVDAMKDCTRRGDVVLDTFSGSGTTIIAAERIGRRARALEYKPEFVDTAVRRWQAVTRKDAIHEKTGDTFDELVARPGAQARPSCDVSLAGRAA
jgi:DNA modification methylase